ncbi:helix-loop-helix DNA-binding domain-containing transcription factor [Phycomyces blakesleeanus]|uniref:Helix-loop-helix DNA-binding domain-containing transcription factor n=2 Tax=Phycomyces blakesleeanus TaxID=4837 RepID=A0A162U234_PHYB8|nr:helix-loop-helix DNA-binding domain-containing transcription factor [Phycomyces blakesleeanus NRRL 1555(-)]OAD71713.1 helix-loop-helix DNA-binding domain-containing transcription factor [Phycomyces blakesleeanus NRRL 1555(-)]|eukprot:XP_018289753.1 helix-loop-helix DNA-binding domain-containing transcription factor [Phycomyces blakesleeanus NRRL 1555(-)]
MYTKLNSLAVNRSHALDGTSLGSHLKTTRETCAESYNSSSEPQTSYQTHDNPNDHLYEKRKRRRESHNAVERRRRDVINDQIYRLSTLLPDKESNKTNKGAVLRRSVDYIHLMQDTLRQYQQRIHEMERILEIYQRTETSYRPFSHAPL